MKKLIIGAAILFIQMSFGQVTKDLGDFDSVKVFDKLSVKLVQGSENKIVIKGTRESEVEVVNKKGLLKLRMPFPKLLSGNDLDITVYYKRIELIDVNEGAMVTSSDVIKATVFKVSAQEGGKINVDLDVDKLNVRIFALHPRFGVCGKHAGLQWITRLLLNRELPLFLQSRWQLPLTIVFLS